MARENQGLQIALIIFVMLTIVLGVTTFIFSSQYKEANGNFLRLDKEKAVSDAKATTTQDENNELKTMMGFNIQDNLGAIQDKKKEDMEACAGALEPEEQYYRQVLTYLNKLVNDKNIELADAKGEIQTWKDQYAIRESEKDVQIQQFDAAVRKASDDLTARTAEYTGERARIAADNQKVHEDWDKSRKAGVAALTKVQTKFDALGDEYEIVSKANRRQGEKIRAMQTETFEMPDGEIRWVNQGNKTVWINLGRADALSRQISFAVYPDDVADLTGGGKKASIEVTQILGDHSAEARIVEDSMNDPIMPGDKIHTPLWSPGEQKRFALAGFLDIDGDGRSDQHTVANLIRMNGGKIDAETDAKTGKRSGQMSVDTRYLVVGEVPDVKHRVGVQLDQGALIKGYSDMIGSADRLGIQKITLGELLQRMGWVNQTRVKTYGRGANPADFRAQPPDGVPRVSTGNTSDFRQRRPPARRPSGRGGAY